MFSVPKRQFVTVRSGILIAIDLYIPPSQHLPAPVLLEALPYRKDDITANSHSDDYQSLCVTYHFVVCRADVRGTGSSSGRATDEYPKEELDDLNDLIDWLSIQSFSNGNIGMYGYSYSAFNSLQLACTRPSALKAIVAVYGTDDRYTDDVHYSGGALRAIDLIDYCNYMTASNALPPVPLLFGDRWRDEWIMRLDNNEPWILNWLEHQRHDSYWLHGSLRPGYDRIQCPTMIVAGWADGYRNNTFRTFENLRCEKSLLVGTWSHSNPRSSLPGPNIDLVPELANWFNRHLRTTSCGTCDTDFIPAPVRLFIRMASPPEPDLEMVNGYWQAESTWPPPHLHTASFSPLSNPASTDQDKAIDLIYYKADVGTAAWNSCAGGLPWGQSTDQREDDAWSLVYDFPIAIAMTVAGHPKLGLTLSSSEPIAGISCKLCNVCEDGTSILVTRGYLHLSHRHSSTDPSPMIPNQKEVVSIELEATTWQFQPGHRMRISLSGSDWPNIWPSPKIFTVEVVRSSVELSLPVLQDSFSPLPTPIFAAVPAVSSVEKPFENNDSDFPPTLWQIDHNVLLRQKIARTFYGGLQEGRDNSVIKEWYHGEVGVSVTNPSHAWATAKSKYDIHWRDEPLHCVVEANMDVKSDEKCYNINIELRAIEDGKLLRTRKWERRILRDFV